MLGDDRFRLLGREGVRCIAKRLRLELQVHIIRESWQIGLL